jgi:hypothetical protein
MRAVAQAMTPVAPGAGAPGSILPKIHGSGSPAEDRRGGEAVEQCSFDFPGTGKGSKPSKMLNQGLDRDLVLLMAAAIIAVTVKGRRKRDEGSSGRGQDHLATPGAKGDRLPAAVLGTTSTPTWRVSGYSTHSRLVLVNSAGPRYRSLILTSARARRSELRRGRAFRT